MARIRTIKPDAFKSDTLSAVSVLARWTFAGLWTYCDDFGKARGDIRLIKAELFPIDDETTVEELQEALNELASNGAICFYEVDDKEYLHCPKWDDHQRVSHPAKSRIPDCVKHSPDFLANPPEEIRSPLESLVPERKGKEQGKGSRNASAPGSDSGEFESFWDTYPKKVAKGAARKAWTAAIKKAPAQTIIAGLVAYVPTVANTEAKFIPHAGSWLYAERWTDQVATPTGGTNTLRPVAEIPKPPDGLTDEQYSVWHAENFGAR